MSLDISLLKYYEACNDKHIDLNNSHSSEIITFEDYKKESEKMLSDHNNETDLLLKEYEKLYRSGKISISDYRMAKLETSANDLIYQLGMNALYGT